mmetsp:Transcript_44250/g.99767  ORF Transcript_44250/g.99767 Transcript_44250/m.99767 type:complete len:95 (+) Transcript_44250:78-362(+)
MPSQIRQAAQAAQEAAERRRQARAAELLLAAPRYDTSRAPPPRTSFDSMSTGTGATQSNVFNTSIVESTLASIDESEELQFEGIGRRRKMIVSL